MSKPTKNVPNTSQTVHIMEWFELYKFVPYLNCVKTWGLEGLTGFRTQEI